MTTSGILFLVAVFLLGWGETDGRAEQTVVEVITLNHRRAEEVIPILQPFVHRDGAISGMQNNLIVRTTPANLAEIKKILSTIDSAPRQLMITVKQDALRDRDKRELEVSGSAVEEDKAWAIKPGSGKDRGLTAGTGHGDDSLRTRALDVRSPEKESNIQQLQVLEGNKAIINIGLSMPLPERYVVRNVEGVHAVETVEYRDVTTGFYVLPRVSGDVVTLEISPHHDTLSKRYPGTVNVQHMTTTVSGRLGEWMEIGGLVQQLSGRRSGILNRTRGTSIDMRRVLIKVDEVE